MPEPTNDEHKKFEQWLDDQLTGKYATGDLELELRMAVSTIRGMSDKTPKDYAVQPLLRLIHQHTEQATQTLRAHLVYMAGQYEGITGKKCAYLLKNWPGYAQLTTNPKEEKDNGNIN